MGTLQFKRGSAEQASTYTGADGELFIDSDNKEIRLHDGVTQGGILYIPKNTIDTAISNSVSTKQQILVSGTNIKTVNGQNILGSGDLIIESTTVTYVDSSVVGTSYSASNGEYLFADTTGGQVIITLPLSPSIGDTVIIHDENSSFFNTNLIVDRNGETIMGLAEDLLLDTNNIKATLIYNGRDWRVS